MKFRDAIKLLLAPARLKARRELDRVRKQPRYTPGRTTLFGRPIEYVDSSSYFFLHEEIFEQEVYAFKTASANPLIIDGGANIGLSVIYFKRLFPAARVVAFEADPIVGEVLKRNLATQEIHDVEVRHEALWTCDTELTFQREGADGGRIGLPSESTVRVPAVALSRYLDEPVHFLKLDIEGAEYEVLESCRDRLGMVDKAFIEYHSKAGEPQQLSELLGLLKDTGFRCYVTAPSVFSPRPFIKTRTYNGFDMVVNIYAIRHSL
jgi:FkbM family methyltransferase